MIQKNQTKQVQEYDYICVAYLRRLHFATMRGVMHLYFLLTMLGCTTATHSCPNSGASVEPLSCPTGDFLQIYTGPEDCSNVQTTFGGTVRVCAPPSTLGRCVDCSPGTSQGSNNFCGTSCTDCWAGTYSGLGWGHCENCVAGKSSPALSTSSVACQNCGAGQGSAAGST